jgi:hypothetical protein
VTRRNIGSLYPWQIGIVCLKRHSQRIEESIRPVSSCCLPKPSDYTSKGHGARAATFSTGTLESALYRVRSATAGDAAVADQKLIRNSFRMGNNLT